MSAGALVVGEALIDEVHDDDRVGRHVGGSPANVALGLARLGVTTRLHTAIGDDSDGGLIREHLAESGVILTAESRTDAPTSRAIATLAPDGSATYEFALGWNPHPLPVLGSPRVIHTGSLGALLEPGAAITADIVRRGRVGGALITLDPNARPSILPEASGARTVFERLAALSHVVKLSEEDAEYLYPGTPLDDVLGLLLAAGVAVAGITRGGEGALLASGGERAVISPVVTTVADTVGAGDSFMAALVWALVFDGDGWGGHPVDRQCLERIGSTAARAAALTVSRLGADLPRADELQERA